jgi:methylthioribulose-1-phosphate dehydratase
MNTLQFKEAIAETIRAYNAKGWSPATSTNYSFKDEHDTIWVSRSGVDKANFQASDFITVDSNGTATGEFEGIQPSAETLIHCVLYELFPATKVILHSHGIYPVLLSAVCEHEVSFEGYEIQKGFAGQTTHEARVTLPVFDNDQDMTRFKEVLIQHKSSLMNAAFIMRKHGVYAWGTSLFEAKRHLETVDYLCQCEWFVLNHPIPTQY